MGDEQGSTAIGNLDSRVARMEQFLPTLATREEWERAIAPLATREDLERGLLNLRDELREEIMQSRRRADVLIEDLRGDTHLILEHLLALSARVDALAGRG